jgi:hypothetical protein
VGGLLATPLWIAAPSAAEGTLALDAYGGHPGLQGTATGYFHAEKLNGRWWLIDPLGNAFYAVGVSLITSGGMLARDGTNPYLEKLKEKYGDPLDVQAWAKDTVDRLKAWGYNTVGPYSSSTLYDRMPYIQDLAVLDASINYIRSQNGGVDEYPILWEESKYDSVYRRHFFDVFNPVFITYTNSYISSTISLGNYQNDPNLIGYVADNEVPLWYGRCVDAPPSFTCSPNSPWLPGKTMADVYIAMPASAEGKQAWVSHLEGKYESIGALNDAWGTSYASFDALLSTTVISDTVNTAPDKSAFLSQIMARYFGTIKGAIEEYDGNHMYLGSRLITCCGLYYAPEVYQQLAAYADVVTLNYYLFDDNTAADSVAMKADLDAMYDKLYGGLGGQRPMMNMEFSFSGEDFRDTDKWPINRRNGAVLPTQEDRARAGADYQRYSVGHPGVVGTMWWSYFDPPTQGAMRGGEDANLGLVDNNDDPYGVMLHRMSYENRSVYTYRGLSASQGSLLSGAFGQGVTVGAAVAGIQPAAASVVITYSVSAPITQTTFTIYDGNDPHGAQKRQITSTNVLDAGAHILTWDRLDQDGEAVADGWYYFVLKVTAADGSTDYGVGKMELGLTVPDWRVDFFRYDAYETMAASTPYTVALSLSNAGGAQWSSNEVSLTYRWLDSNSQPVQEGQVSLPHDVAPYSSVVLTATMQTPGLFGDYTLEWNMQKEGAPFEYLAGEPPSMVVTLVPAFKTYLPITFRNY